VLTVVSILLAIFVLEGPWRYAAVVTGVTLDLAENAALLWWSRRRRAAVGIQTLVGATAVVVTPCRPHGQVRVAGELWGADCPDGADPGDEVEIRSVDGLTLRVGRSLRARG
jgi:membrane protein implicated in regulation of membrane protease activity